MCGTGQAMSVTMRLLEMSSSRAAQAPEKITCARKMSEVKPTAASVPGGMDLAASCRSPERLDLRPPSRAARSPRLRLSAAARSRL